MIFDEFVAKQLDVAPNQLPLDIAANLNTTFDDAFDAWQIFKSDYVNEKGGSKFKTFFAGKDGGDSKNGTNSNNALTREIIAKAYQPGQAPELRIETPQM